MPIWPLGLPQRPLRSNFKESMPSNLLTSSMGTGPAKIRRRGNAKPVPFSVTYALTDTQLAILDEFTDATIAGGAICFDFPHPRTGQYMRVRLSPQSEDALYDKQYFGKTLRWQIQLKLEAFPDAPLT